MFNATADTKSGDRVAIISGALPMHIGVDLGGGSACAEDIGSTGAWRPSRVRMLLHAGGGAGHEPAHAGYVGPGMLTAAVCGDVFASPSAAAVLAAIRQVTVLCGRQAARVQQSTSRCNGTTTGPCHGKHQQELAGGALPRQIKVPPCMAISSSRSSEVTLPPSGAASCHCSQCGSRGCPWLPCWLERAQLLHRVASKSKSRPCS